MEYRKITELKEYPNNPRKITPEKLEKLKESITKNADYFEGRPILLSNRTGKLVIIAGNMKFRAAKELGLLTVPTILMEGLTEEREKEIVLLDNVPAGSWDEDILKDFDFNFESIGMDIPITIPEINNFNGSDKDFEKTFNGIKDEQAINPVVPEFMEGYNAFIILTTNQIDELYVRNIFNLQKTSNTVGLADRVANIITVEQVKAALK